MNTRPEDLHKTGMLPEPVQADDMVDNLAQ